MKLPLYYESSLVVQRRCPVLAQQARITHYEATQFNIPDYRHSVHLQLRWPDRRSIGQSAACSKLPPGDESSQPINSLSGGGINSGLTDRLVTTYNFQPYELDLSTGAGRELPLVTNKERLDGLNDGQIHDEFNYFAASANPSNQGYVETSYSCFGVPTGSCLSIYNSNYQVVRRVAVTDRTLQSPAKLSRSGELIVMSDMDTFFNEASYILIMDVDSRDVTDSIELDHEIAVRGNLRGHPVVEWGLNDEVFFSVPADDRPSDNITKPGTTDICETIRLPSSYSGVIKSLDLHPNDRQLLLGYDGDPDAIFDRNGLAIVFDLDDLNLRIPAVNETDAQRMPIGENSLSQYVNPMWSPDARHIMFLNRFNLAKLDDELINPDIQICRGLIAIPADSNRVIVNKSNRSSPAPAIVVKLADPIRSGELSIAWRGDTFKGGYISWIQ